MGPLVIIIWQDHIVLMVSCLNSLLPLGFEPRSLVCETKVKFWNLATLLSTILQPYLSEGSKLLPIDSSSIEHGDMKVELYIMFILQINGKHRQSDNPVVQ